MIIEVEYCSNTKIANTIRERDDLCGNCNRINVGGPNKQMENTFAITKTLSCFDCDVADAIYTLYRNGYSTFTPGQVLRTMSGDYKQTITVQKKKDIIDSINKLRKTEIMITCEEEFRVRKQKFDGENAYELEGKYLLATWHEKAKCFEMKKELPLEVLMPLYRYTELNTQMISFPINLLSCGDSSGEKISNTKENILIKRYLIRRIEIMRVKGERKTNNNIIKRDRSIIYVRRSHKERKDVGLLPTIGVYDTKTKSELYWKRKIHNVHETVKKILDYYCAIGYIEGYEEVRGDYNRITGVQIVGEIENPWNCF